MINFWIFLDVCSVLIINPIDAMTSPPGGSEVPGLQAGAGGVHVQVPAGGGREDQPRRLLPEDLVLPG